MSMRDKRKYIRTGRAGVHTGCQFAILGQSFFVG